MGWVGGGGGLGKRERDRIKREREVGGRVDKINLHFIIPSLQQKRPFSSSLRRHIGKHTLLITGASNEGGIP